MTISQKACQDLLQNLTAWNGLPAMDPNLDLIIETYALKRGWGASLLWSNDRRMLEQTGNEDRHQ